MTEQEIKKETASSKDGLSGIVACEKPNIYKQNQFNLPEYLQEYM